MTQERPAFELLEQALRVLNDAVETTAEQGPAVAMEAIADYLNNVDAVDCRADECPEDWLTRWSVVRHADGPIAVLPGGEVVGMEEGFEGKASPWVEKAGTGMYRLVADEEDGG